MEKKKQLQEWLTAANVALVDEHVRNRIAAHLAPVSPSYLRRLLIRSGMPLDPLVEGVRQDSLEDAERTLVALSAVYVREPKKARALVIEAKDHARLALARTNAPGAAALKRELIEWMIVWVNDPALFPTWVRLRLRTIESRSNPPE